MTLPYASTEDWKMPPNDPAESIVPVKNARSPADSTDALSPVHRALRLAPPECLGDAPMFCAG